MDEKSRDTFRRQLLAERQNVVDRLDETNRFGMGESLRDAVSELSMYDNHPGDLGSETFEREKDDVLADMDRNRLKDIDDALSRVESGTYGICERCHETIPSARLEIQPAARYCVSCQREQEAFDPGPERPIEESFTAPPFARTFLDDTDYVAFDGEDSWQAVLRYNRRPRAHLDDEYLFEEEHAGIVDITDAISNEEYWAQLPD